MSTHFLLIGTTDKGDPNAIHFADREELNEYVHEHSIDPKDPRYLLIEGGQLVNFVVPPSTIEIVRAGGAPVEKKKRTRRTKAELEAARLNGEKVPGRKPKANGADTTAVAQ